MIDDINNFINVIVRSLVPDTNNNNLIGFRISLIIPLATLLAKFIKFSLKRVKISNLIKDKIIRTSPIQEKILWFGCIVFIYLFLNVFLSLFITNMIIYGIIGINKEIFKLNITRWFPYFKNILYIVISAILLFIATYIIIIVIKLRDLVDKYILKNKWIIWMMIFIIPVSVFPLSFTVFNLNQFIINVCILVYTLDLIVGMLILTKMKIYNKYFRVSVTLINGSTLYLEYENVKKDHEYLIRIKKDQGKTIKKEYYPLSNIKRIVYFVDNEINVEYDQYLKEKYEKLLSLYKNKNRIQ